MIYPNTTTKNPFPIEKIFMFFLKYTYTVVAIRKRNKK